MSAHSVGGDDGLSAGHTRYSTSTPYNIILYYYKINNLLKKKKKKMFEKQYSSQYLILPIYFVV